MKKIRKALSVVIALSVFIQAVLPNRTYAMTGPSQPEFSSFESVSTSGMVNEFSGGFSYNIPVLEIPGANGGGYALSLSYKSGTSPDEDASWVGYGWTINPGAVVRSKSGFPDDVKAGEMTSYNKIPRNWTASLGTNLTAFNIEAFSLSATLGETNILQYNNHTGFAYIAYPSVVFGLANGIVSLGLSYQDGEGSFSASVNPANAMSFFRGSETETREKIKINKIQAPIVCTSGQMQRIANSLGGTYNQYSNAFISYFANNSSRTSNIQEYTAKSYKLNVGVQGELLPMPVGLGTDLWGSYSFQDAVESDAPNFYGYMYSSNAAKKSNALMDYYTEKDGDYNKRDYYMSIPWARPDQFILMGEGLSGGFRAFSKKAGHFKVNEKENETKLYQLGLDIMAGSDFGLGGSIESGKQTLSVGEWEDGGTNDDYQFSNDADEDFYFSFMMDPAQYMSYGGDAVDLEAYKFVLNGGGTSGSMSYTAQYPPSLPSTVDELANVATHRIPRSSEIIYHTNKQMTDNKDLSGIQYNRYSRPTESHESYLDRTSAELQEQIGEFVVYNNSGNQYVYGLPVYAKNEKNLSFDISSPSLDYLVKENISSGNEKKVGEFIETPYATSWLLTSITTPNYIDRTLDGPTSDDFGGWTKFNYSKLYGDNTTSGEWYHWRTPYNQLYNNPGSLSDDKDDMGSYSSGDKEMYYVKTIETNTHIAGFYTSARLDGLDAADDETAANSSTAKGTHGIQKLDSICLYAKDADNTNLTDNPTVKRIYFDYDYSLMNGQPNSDDGSGNTTGKLTLKKVWFEYGDVRNAKISPFEFEYTYTADGTYPSKYASLDGYGASLQENPDYDPLNVDCWGNYQYNGAERFNKFKSWVNQVPDAAFDPAAWQLKQIKLPTGGEIHVQYEQNDYTHVQDRKALAMVSLSGTTTNDTYEGNLGDKFYLNTSELGLSTAEEKRELANLIQQQCIERNDPQKIYFKFLYSFFGDNSASLGDCGMEYIDGYVNVAEVSYDETIGEVYVKLGASTDDGSETDETYSVPREVCKDFYNKTRSGNINSSDFCTDDGLLGDSEDAETIIYNLLGKVGSIVVDNNINLCMKLDEANSYLRVPVVNAKKGGGIRVKRILTYDAGIENGDESLYGKEYVYQTTDGESSGVATNEPSANREENALITYLEKREDSNWFQRIISGRDKEQYEGPLGEGILPGPSIGYSRIVIKNIHTDENTNDGFEVKDFYTSKDYPFDGSWSYTDESTGSRVTINAIKNTDISQESDFNPMYAVIYNRVVSNIWATQGYRFVVNDMNGKPKTAAVYSGNYENINDITKVSLESGMSYEYYQPGEPVKVVDKWEWKDESAITPEYRILGKQMDVVMESRSIKDHFSDFTIEIDASLGFLPLPPFFIPWISGMGYVNEKEDELYTHVTNKVLYLSSQLKRITKYQDGIEVSTQNEYFNSLTGEAMVSVTNDGYHDLKLDGNTHDGRYVNFSFPAAHYYNGVSYKSYSQGLSVENASYYDKVIDGSDIYLEYSGSDACALEVFTPGDLISLKNNDDGNIELYNVGKITGRTIELLPNGDYGYNNTNHNHMEEIIIVRTERMNELSSSVGNVTTYGGYPDVINVAIDQSILDARQEVADALNALLSKTGTMTISLSYPDVSIVDDNGDCVPLNLTSTYSHTTNSYSIPYTEDKIICTPLQDCDEYNADGTPIADKYLYSFGNPGYYTCYDCDTVPETKYNTLTISKIGLNIGSCELEFTWIEGYIFYIDDESGELMYGDETNPCDAVLVDCIDFCPDEYAKIKLDGVVACSAVSLSDSWNLPSNLQDVYKIPSTDLNKYEYGAKGQWRINSKYDYNTSTGKITATDGHPWNTGIYDNFTVFNWGNEDANEAWTKLVTNNKVSPHGASLSELNALGIYSCAKYGYDHSLPYLMASNAIYNNLLFEGFETAEENGSNLKCEDGYKISQTSGYYGYLVSDKAHSGKKSLYLNFDKSISTSAFVTTTSYESELILQDIQLNNQVIDNGYSVKLWVKMDNSLTDFKLKYSKYSTSSSAMVNASTAFNKIAQTGEWALYEATITDIGTEAKNLVSTITPTVYLKYAYEGISLFPNAPEVYLDDIRMQPLTAQMIAYVYDPATLKLIASFDDQHLGLYYQYNEEGKLIRKLKETVEGVKTITESQYNVAKKNSRP